MDDRAEKSRRDILDAALPVFMENGYAAASLNQIIRASGLTKGGFYFHFPSKLALALAVVKDSQERGLAQVMEEVSRHSTATERFVALPRILARQTLEGVGPAAFNRLVADLSQDAELRPQVCGSVELSIQAVAGQIREAQAEGSIRADVDPEAMADFCVGAFIGMQNLSDQLNDARFLERIEVTIRTVQRAVMVDPPSGAV